MNNASMAGKICAITGPTSGIGRSTALALGRKGARLILLCRSAEKGAALVAELAALKAEAEVIEVNLSSLSSVARAAERLSTRAPQLDVLINNAGLINTGRRESADGIEEMFAVNHLAHFLLTNRVLQNLRAAPEGRIVHVASGAHAFVNKFDFDDYTWHNRRWATMKAYGHSKLANLLFNRSLSLRLGVTGSVTSNALHPGAVGSNMGSNNGWTGKLGMALMKPFFLTPDKGAETSIYLAAAAEAAGHRGGYFIKCAPAKPKPWAEDDAAAERLWGLSAALLAERQMSI
jgi:NAD(P)-dependent dehydrogenase (short-subunit alcohol dehydrogenase family)